jgi:hypothetical protein
MLETVANLTQTRNLSTIDSALARLRGVSRLLALHQSAPKVSDSRLREFARRFFHRVAIRVVPIEAEADPESPDPSEDELLAHFEKYKDVAPGEGDHGFGYRLPNRFKIEWFRISTDDIRAMVQSSDALSGTALAKHYLRYKDERNFPEVAADEPLPDIVREDLLGQLVERRRQALKQYIASELQMTWRALDIKEGYYELPEDWADRRIKFRELIQSLQREFDGLPLPEYNAIGDRWLTLDDLAETDLSGTRTFKFDMNQPTGLRRLINGMKEFDGAALFLTQVGITGPPLENADKDVIYYRVTAADPARPPHDIDEVRDQLVSDLKRLQEYERLRARADEIEALADEQGLLGVAMAYDTDIAPPTSAYIFDAALLQFMMRQNVPIQPRPSSLPVVGPDRETNERIVDRALAFPRETPLRDVPRADRTFALPVDEKLCVLVVELNQQFPFSNENYESLVASNRLQALEIGEEFEETDFTVYDEFSYESLAARHNFKLKRRDTDEESDAKGEETAETTATADASRTG